MLALRAEASAFAIFCYIIGMVVLLTKLLLGDHCHTLGGDTRVVGGDEEVGAAGLPHVDVGESARMDRQGRLIQSANRGDTAAISAAASAPQTPGLGMVRGEGKRGRNQV
jgi:hypothetical protein